MDMTGTHLAEVNLAGANLSGVDLSGKDMAGTYLLGINLSKANLKGADLTKAELAGANLTSADLTDAILIHANMTETNLFEADLTGANLTGANLSAVNLSDANLTGVNLDRANLDGTDLYGTNLYGASLSGTSLTTANLKDTTLAQADLSGTDLRGVDLSGMDLSGANLTKANLAEVNLDGTDLYGTNLYGASLSGTSLTTANLKDTTLAQADLSGTDLRGVDLSGMDLSGANLSGLDLSGENLREVVLVGADLTGINLARSNLTGANLSGAYLYDAQLVNANLSETILVDIKLNRTNLTGANLLNAELVGIELEKIDRPLGDNLIEIQENQIYSQVTSIYFGGGRHYVSTKPGILYELTNQRSKIVLDLQNTPGFQVINDAGLLSIASNNHFFYISYIIDALEKTKNRSYYLVVDEYSKTFEKVRNIIKIGMANNYHFGGNVVFDNLGMMYLSVGDGGRPSGAQNLNSLRGKILRFDVSKKNPEPEVVAYGLRSPWKVSIDSKNRMFIGDCGDASIESVYLLKDLYISTLYNLGWPVFEGTLRNKEDPLMLQDTLAPIYEYKTSGNIGRCVIGGYYLDHLEMYLFGDFSGILRLIKQQRDGTWREVYFQRVPMDIWSFGYNEKTKKLFVSSSSNIFELKMPTEQTNIRPHVTLCKTTMSDGTINNSDCL
jgi:uncharacterized protein YjbI with pentapeptide repeats